MNDKPADFDDALPMFRLSVENCHGDQFVEMLLDAADLEVVDRVFTALNNGINTARGKHCAANLRVHVRVKPGDIKDEGNFVIWAEIKEG